MKTKISARLSGLSRYLRAAGVCSLTALYICACSSNSKDELAHSHHDHEGHAEAAEEHDHEHEGHDHEHENENENENGKEQAGDVITLKPEMAERFGVVAKTINPAPFRSVIKVSGMVTDSPDETAVVVAPYAGTVSFCSGIAEGSAVHRGQAIARINSGAVSGGNPNASAKAAMDAAKRELDRLTPLYKERLVTASEYNAAEAAYRQARAAYSSGASGNAATASVGGNVISLDVPSGAYVNAGDVIATVGNNKHLRLRADLPASNSGILSSLTDARFKTSGMTGSRTVSALEGHRTSSTSSSRALSSGYIPVYFTFTNDGTLVPGTPATVWLLGTESPDRLTVPLSALSEQQGLYYIYEKLDEDCYRRLPVTLGESDGESVEVLSGLEPGKDIVVQGTVTVKIAGNTSAIPAHSHSH